MFFGQVARTLDAKGRLIIPAQYRDELGSGAYITRGFDRNLSIMPKVYFEEVYRKVNAKSITDPAARQLKRFLFANADYVEPDKMGRIRIPAFLREAIQLQDEVTVTGVGDFLELWVPDVWQAYLEKLENDELNAEVYSGVDLSDESSK
jgi:MraZ protein